MKLIPLTKGYFAKVDDEDFERLMKYRWQVNNPSKSKHITYAKRTDRTCGQRSVSMHREIMGITPGFEIDHIDNDGLNNQKSNLRLATQSQNCQHRRKPNYPNKYKGVCFHKRNRNYQVEITVNGKRKYLGWFRDAKEAAMVYDRAALMHSGEFAVTNQQLGLL